MTTQDNTLAELSAAECETIARQFGIAVHEGGTEHLNALNHLLETNRGLYVFFRLHYILAIIGTNGIYITFPVTSSSDGVNTISQMMNPDWAVASEISLPIGIVLSIIEVLFYMATVSPKREALLSTFNFLQLPVAETNNAVLGRISLQVTTTLQNFKSDLTSFPCDTITDTLFLSAHQLMLLVYNLTWISAALVFLPPTVAKPLSPVIFFYGYEYCRKYTNPDYYNGVTFWREGGLFKLMQLARRSPLTAAQILLQSMSNVGLRAFPVFYFLAIATTDVLGVWTPPALTAGVAVFVGTNIYFLSTYQHYTEADQQISQLTSNASLLTSLSNERFMQFRTQFLQTMSCWNFIKQETVTSALILARTVLGGYLGYGLVTLISTERPSPYLLAFFVVIFSVTLGTILYHVEKNRIISNAYLHSLQPTTMSSTPNITKTVKAIAAAINVAGGSVNTLSNMGLLLLLFGEGQAMLKGLFFIFLIESTINNTGYNQSKCETSIHGIAETIRNYTCLFFRREPSQDDTALDRPLLVAPRPSSLDSIL